MAVPVQILLVEDNPADADLTRETMETAKIRNEVNVVYNGNAALAYLHKQHPYEDAVTPDIVFLDLNLPGMDGREVLRRIKSDESIRNIPVVVLTSSEAQEDVVKSYDLHCNAYVRKPVNLEGYQKIVQAVDGFWFSVVKLPS